MKIVFKMNAHTHSTHSNRISKLFDCVNMTVFFRIPKQNIFKQNDAPKICYICMNVFFVFVLPPIIMSTNQLNEKQQQQKIQIKCATCQNRQGS